MAIIDTAVQQVGSLANDVVGTVADMATTGVSNIGNAINAVTDPAELMRYLRASAIAPLGGSTFKSLIVDFLGPEDANDWRVRLSIPFNFFMGSAVFAPLVEAGGFVFPYTPTITLSGGANYSDIEVTHQNFPFMAYQNSKPGEITIDGPFNVEDSTQALYWIACIHFLRSVTKMHTGTTASHGSPPPILSLNAYGDYVFKKIPVVVKSFQITLGNDCDYIETETEHGFNFSWQSLVPAGLMSGIDKGEVLGGLASGLVSEGLNAIGMSTNKAHVPTKSSISVTLAPVYSREAVRQFSLQSFVNGAYVSGGFI